MKYLILLATAALIALPLRGQDAPNSHSDQKLYRDPYKAVVLGSIIPGAGHIYAGEYLKGVLTYEATVGTIGMGTMAFFISDGPQRAIGVAGIGVGFWMWASSARDARRAAERANERHRRRFESSVSPIIRPFSGPSSSSQIGVSVHW